jgi:hypothetical protein
VDTWNWISSSPAPQSGTRAHQSTIASGMHQHFFTSAAQTMSVGTGDMLYAYVYVDPANIPTELMLQWNDGSSWNHRAYWGANTIVMGTDGTISRQFMGPIPTAGQWVMLQIPASVVGLEGKTVSGMAFTMYDGRATWDVTGKGTSTSSGNGGTTPPGGGTDTNTPPVTDTNTPPIVDTNTPPVTDTNLTGTNPPPVVDTNPPPVTDTNPPAASTNALTGDNNWLHTATVDYTALVVPKIGDYALHVLSPTLLELRSINTAPQNTTTPTSLNLIGSGFTFNAPAPGSFAVTANGQSVTVQAVGFKRRPLFAPLAKFDLRIDNAIYLQLASPISDNQTIQVSNPNGTLWNTSMKFTATVDPLRFNPAIHVNHEGYMPNY